MAKMIIFVNLGFLPVIYRNKILSRILTSKLVLMSSGSWWVKINLNSSIFIDP